MDMHLQCTGMGRLVGPAGGSANGPGSGISTQFRILPNALPSESAPPEMEIVSSHSQVQPQKLRCGTPKSPRPFASEPLHSASGSPHSLSPEKDYFLFRSSSLLLRYHQNGGKEAAALVHSQSMPARVQELDLKVLPQLVGANE